MGKKVKKKGRLSKTTGHQGLRVDRQGAARQRGVDYQKKMASEYQKYKAPKLSKAFKTAAKKKAAKSLAKSVVGKMVPPLGVALAATEVYKAGKKGLKDRKSRISCEKKGGVWKKGYCITRSSKKKK